jgi:hypothetical protein
LTAAHNRARDDGGELRLVIPTDGSVPRVLAVTGPAGIFQQRTELAKRQRDLLSALKIDARHASTS